MLSPTYNVIQLRGEVPTSTYHGSKYLDDNKTEVQLICQMFSGEIMEGNTGQKCYQIVS